MDSTNPNLALFLREMPTNTEWMGEETTKPFKKGGGFSGTSLDAMYVVARLTSAFGPVGIGWGYEVKSERDLILPPSPEGKVRGTHFAVVRFWYKHNGEVGTFEEIGGTPLTGFGDDDAGKKSVTDAITKAASRIGIGADIHLGRFDDNKYVTERQEATRNAARQSDAKRKADLRVAARKVRQLLDDAIDAAVYHEGRRQALELKPKLDAEGMDDEAEMLGQALADARVRTAPRQAAE
jgi:hypothetical protein